MANHKDLHKLSAAGLLISLGIIYGDIGTSPLYVFKAIIGDRIISTDLILGGLSCIFWTLTLQTTIKYVIITLRADNKGEGGIFSLYSLVKRKARWLVFPAMIGGASLLADGMITPPITISSAIEGLQIYSKDLPTVPIVMVIITFLFIIQQFGTSHLGKAFGPIMFVWFASMAVLGGAYVLDSPFILKAVNPYYAWHILYDNPSALLIIGAVFLCTTGAEALYSDLGHCGRSNIRISWIFVKICLLLNYFGQGVWLWQHQGATLGEGNNPFYLIMPEWFIPYGIGIATLAAVIASQAMITGSFTLISEAVRLNLWPKVKINYPSIQKGQLYVPSMNWILWGGCIVVILLFKKSAAMEGAYGLAITITFIMTTILMSVYLMRKRFPGYFIVLFALIYGLLELVFLVGNMAKFFHGGWFTILLSLIIFSVMWSWSAARRIKNRYVKFVEIEDYYQIISDLSEDSSVPKYSSQLVYLTSANFKSEIEAKIMYSILQKQPKRADVYWLVHVDVTDEPYTLEYKVDFLVPEKLIRIDFRLGFRVEQRINVLFRLVVEDLVRNGEIDITSKYPSLNKHHIVGDFRFVVLEKVLSRSNRLNLLERLTMAYYFVLKRLGLSEEKGFGLDLSFVTVEQVPLIVTKTDTVQLTRVD
ncbi:KUP system potassium uptake protein [Arcticibacter pallidicorallinus]|uniref:Probable potassium transport system protein Kup n=1 Tax=Arcticibacter pallidicorallinus TaxID=1259464 RepID=A0A2T0TUX2_9SPHI|nr:KUP/HAK/KT family potassium transporter [Arcticibacter pallidicorallinus]PRY49459.1 KUP system potassium uptake protein [Arcticibacter pallidicorallinus]